MRTALYLRVSTAQQRPDLQADGLHGYAARAGLEIVAEYLDRAVSGRQEGRPQLQALMRAARQHEFACVLVRSSIISKFGPNPTLVSPAANSPGL
jgi:site-specific DNA recombinase